MNNNLIPFIKWVGGKRQLLPQIKQRIPKNFGTYHEPFLGAGALFFDLEKDSARVNDLNLELVNVYETIRDDVDSLIKELNHHKSKNSKDYYYEIRDWDRSPSYTKLSPVKKAARFIYMNKVGYNGLYRVNSKGQFNVPYGRYKNPSIFDEDLLRKISTYLNSKDVKFSSVDFEEAVKDVKQGDFVYFDPPYDPLTKTSSFTKYHKDGFSSEDQKRLKRCADALVHKGAKVILSNSNTKFINDLYNNKIDDAKSDVKYFIIELIEARRSINSVADKRGKIKEVLIISKDE
jgi:DNA adenine methylase